MPLAGLAAGLAAPQRQPGVSDTGDAQHPSMRPNGRGAGLGRMDGEQDTSEWTGAEVKAFRTTVTK